MSIYDEKPWLSRYDQDQPAEISLEFTDALAMFRASVSRNPDGDIIRYFGSRITARDGVCKMLRVRHGDQKEGLPVAGLPLPARSGPRRSPPESPRRAPGEPRMLSRSD